VGVEKAVDSGIFASRVFDLKPLIGSLTNKFTLTVCDDIIEDELKDIK
jgi:hypothetical protein